MREIVSAWSTDCSIALHKLHRLVVLAIWALHYHLSSIFAPNKAQHIHKFKILLLFYHKDFLHNYTLMNFQKKITKNGPIFCFSTVTSFVLKIEKTFFLAQIGTWCFRRFWTIYHCSTTRGYRDMQIIPHANCRDCIWGVAGWKMGAMPLEQILSKFWTICRDLRTTLFSIFKKSYFHSTLVYSIPKVIFLQICQLF